MIETSNQDTAALAPALLDSPAGSSASNPPAGAARERIHRFAGMVHQAIDKLEQRLDSGSRGAAGAQSRYGEQARQYGDQLRQRITERPLQTAGIALGAGVVLTRLMSSRAPKVRVVQVPVPVRTAAPLRTSHWSAAATGEPMGRRWTDTVGTPLRSLWRGGQDAGRKAGAVAGTAATAGVLGTKTLATTLSGVASTLPLQARLATQRLLARSQAYGSMARAGVQAHPMAGAGALLGVAALAATPLLRRRAATASPYVTVDESGNGLAWRRDRDGGTGGGLGETVAARPVLSAAVLLGAGALAAAMLRRS